jgi:hypothetical protein
MPLILRMLSPLDIIPPSKKKFEIQSEGKKNKINCTPKRKKPKKEKKTIEKFHHS